MKSAVSALICLITLGCAAPIDDRVAENVLAYCAIDPPNRLGLLAVLTVAIVDEGQSLNVPVVSSSREPTDRFMQRMAKAGLAVPGAEGSLTLKTPTGTGPTIDVRTWHFTREGVTVLREIVDLGSNCRPLIGANHG